MGSIRPLITITILVGVGAFLFTKINEVPVTPPENAQALSDGTTDVPALAAESTTTAPAWSGSTNDAAGAAATIPDVPPVSLPAEIPSVTVAQETATIAAPTTTTPTTVPAELPPIPELPPVGAVVEANAAPATAPAEASPIPLPANIPVARYPGDATSAATTPEPVKPVAPVAVTPPVASAYQPSTTPQQVTPTAEAVVPEDRYGALANDTTSVTSTTTQTTTTTPGLTPTNQPVTPTTPATASFASEWPQIQGALERQELVAAHEMLSRWYGNPSLTAAESQQVEVLLSQLAGTVVYSTEHRLEPPYTVHSGDTLQTIAQQYDVPWQLLAKINGVPAANAVQPGQQLKVVHGPFSAVIELDKSQMTLMLDGRYAGRFPITVPSDANVSEGKWVLEQKLVQPVTQEAGVVSASYTAAAVEHVLVLRNEATGGQTISISAGPGTPSGPTAVSPAAIRLSPRDVEEVADILSVGSPVTIRR